jgi:hypothetical protein
MGNKYTLEAREDRRSVPRSETVFFKIMLALNVLGWSSLVVVLVLFHFARPELISGVQEYWGIKGRDAWVPEYVSAMRVILQICLSVSLISIVMRARRSRRQGDNLGVNLIILIVIATISLITLLTMAV